VAILAPGSYTDRDGRSVSFSAADLRQLADNYDPDYHRAPLNVDHREQGPALGIVDGLSFDGHYLRADLSRVPTELANEIDAGRYPFRSAEVYANLEGRGPYLRALALLGAKPPAVKGLPPMPGREQAQNSSQMASAPAAAEEQGLGAHPQPSGALARNNPKQPTILQSTAEVHMSENTQSDAAKEPAPPVEQETVQLAEENLRLAEENRLLRHSEHRREIAGFLSGLREQGQLTPAMELAGVEEALLLAEDQHLLVHFPDERQVPLSQVLREVLKALPVSIQLGEAARGQQPIALTADEQEIAATLGLSEDEYAQIKRGEC